MAGVSGIGIVFVALLVGFLSYPKWLIVGVPVAAFSGLAVELRGVSSYYVEYAFA